jgi:hypothetical protein
VKAIYANDIEYCYEHGLSIPNYDKEYAEMKRKYSDALLARKPEPSKMKSDDECKHIMSSDDYALFARKPEPSKMTSDDERKHIMSSDDCALFARKPEPSKMTSDDERKHIMSSDDCALFARKPEPSKMTSDDECKLIMSSDESDASDGTPTASGTASANLKDGDELAEPTTKNKDFKSNNMVMLDFRNSSKEPAEPDDIDGTKSEEVMHSNCKVDLASTTDNNGKSEEDWHLEAEQRRERINCLVRSIYLSSNDDRNNNNSGERDVFLEMKENDCLVKAIYAADIEFCKQHILSIPNYDKDYKEMKHKYRNAPLLARTSQPSKMMPDNNEVSKKRKYKGHKNYLENVRTKKHKKYSAYLRKCKQEIKEKMKQLRELEDKKYDSDSDEESDSNSDDNCFLDSDEGSD